MHPLIFTFQQEEGCSSGCDIDTEILRFYASRIVSYSPITSNKNKSHYLGASYLKSFQFPATLKIDNGIGRDKSGQNQRCVPKIQAWKDILQLQRYTLRPTTYRRPTLCQTRANRCMDQHSRLVQKQGISSMLASQSALS